MNENIDVERAFLQVLSHPLVFCKQPDYVLWWLYSDNCESPNHEPMEYTTDSGHYGADK